MLQKVKIMPPHKAMLQKHLDGPRKEVGLAFTRRSELMDRYDFSEVLDIAKLKVPVPARTPVSDGRTVYVYVEPGSMQSGSDNLTSIKLKGAAAVTSTTGSIKQQYPKSILAPLSEVEYNAKEKPNLHLFLAENLKINSVPESRKAAFSLTSSGADREFDCMFRAAKIGRSCDPLFAAKRVVDGKIETDFLGRETGVTSSLFGFNNEFAAEYLSFAAVEDSLLVSVVHGNDTSKALYNDFNNALNIVFDLFKEMGSAKREAAVEAHVARHNGNPLNYIINKKNGHAFLADLDSAVILEGIEQNRWGPQLMRDLTTDTMRAAAIFSLTCAVPSTLEYLNGRNPGPFHHLFSGFFKDLLPSETISKAASAFNEKYLKKAEKAEFAEIRELFVAGTEADMYEARNHAFSKMNDLLHPLHADALNIFYKVFHESSVLRERGFTIPRLNMSELKIQNHFRNGVAQYYRDLKESGRFV